MAKIYTKPVKSTRYGVDNGLGTGHGSNSSTSNSSSAPQAATPVSGNPVTSFPTGVPGFTGSATSGVTEIKTGKADAQGGTVLLSETYKGGSGVITTAEGKQVPVQVTQTPPSAQQARNEILLKSGGVGLSNKQLNEYESLMQKRSNTRSIAIDSAAVDKINRDYPGTAQQYFRNQNVQSNVNINKASNKPQSFNPLAPRSINPNETPSNMGAKDLSKYSITYSNPQFGGQINAQKPGDINSNRTEYAGTNPIDFYSAKSNNG